jgi:hypothetical protein
MSELFKAQLDCFIAILIQFSPLKFPLLRRNHQIVESLHDIDRRRTENGTKAKVELINNNKIDVPKGAKWFSVGKQVNFKDGRKNVHSCAAN